MIHESSADEPARMVQDPQTPPALLDMLSAAKRVQPADADKARLALQLGGTLSPFAGPAIKWILGTSLVIGIGAGAATLPRTHGYDVSSRTAARQAAKVVSPEPSEDQTRSAEPADAGFATAPLAVAEAASTEIAPPEAASPSVSSSPSTRSPKTLAEAVAGEASVTTSRRVHEGSERPAGTPLRSAGSTASGSAPPSEAQLLMAARGLLTSDPESALNLLRQHQALFPRGTLAEERDVLRVRALEALGQLESARNEAVRFQKNHPGSAHDVSK